MRFADLNVFRGEIHFSICIAGIALSYNVCALLSKSSITIINIVNNSGKKSKKNSFPPLKIDHMGIKLICVS